MNRCVKRVLFLVLVIILISTVSCNGPQGKKDSKELLQGNIKIVTDMEHGPQLKFAANRFSETYKKVTVDVITVKGTDDNIKSILDNSKYQADILTVNDSYVKHILSAYSDKILKITDSVSLYKNILLSNKVNNDTIKGSIYALPWDTCPETLIYRKDIFAKEGIDENNIKTWNDYIEAGKKIKKDTGKVFMADVSNYDSDIFLLLANQLGTSYFNESGKLGFESQKWSKVMDIAKILYRENLIKDFSSKSNLINELKGDKIVSFIGDPTYAKSLMNTYSKDSYKWGIMKFPSFEAGGNRDVSVGGTNLIINKNTKQAKLAQTFINFALTDDKLQMDLLNKYGRFPASINIYNLVDFNKQVSYFDNRIWNLFAEVEQGSFNINYTKDFPRVREKVKKILTATNVENKDFKTIMENIEMSLKSN
ncbi:ABC transporter substrate-binding protein [Clostridium sp. HV4-5-A1G]|uniref:ABC transporter substrate-binding protein n=1 Tax=Clostridium sp. HV4-5-A1G TaxID=2004595 RepID=UPI00123AE807|nr:ABC transporter substrate-binding protein [Clostridium sp. HV4-5-A1G]KAA8675907.1 carbohydrate ABC transporter substrate-binding protein [Clostridium sp. HV4-5-A1G]CAB1254152.1 Putative arabinose-binding protein [Clostridiaceae bacterium BL-3]